MTAAVRLAGGFTVAASYGDFDDKTALDDPAAWRMILILRQATEVPGHVNGAIGML